MPYTDEYDTDEQPRSALPADLADTLDACFPSSDAGTDYHAEAALEVIARLLPYAGGTGEVVATVFPYDGPHSSDSVADAARAMSAIGRYLNNATQYPHTLPYGQTVATVIGNVKTVLFQFDQLLEQTAAAALRLAEDPALYSDQVPYPADGDREQWMADRHDAGVTAAMRVADALHQLRARLVTWDSQGFRPVGGLAEDLTGPAALANQLGHTITDDTENDAEDDR